MDNTNSPYHFQPVVGLGVTYIINGDSYPYTIREVMQNGRRFTATADKFVANPNVEQAYSENDLAGVFIPDPEGRELVFTRKRDGRYQPKSQPYVQVSVGRSYRQDPSF